MASRPLKTRLRAAAQRLLLGSTDLPQVIDLGLHAPQTEIVVWLHGAGDPRDVTHRHSVACTSPFIVCIGFERQQNPPPQTDGTLLLRLCERGGRQRCLGEIQLRLKHVVPTLGPSLYLFQATRCTNLCIPKLRLWAHDLHHSFMRLRDKASVKMKVSLLEDRCNAVMFICPRPVVAVSVHAEAGSSIFPMNLMGAVGDDYFVFALNSAKRAALLVERVGQAALSTIPLEHAKTLRYLRGNHYQQSIDWSQLPFQTRDSPTLRLPIPEFALTVRDLQVVTVLPLGSHTLFVARILGEERLSSDPQFYMIHGIYEAWRRSHGRQA